MPNFSKPKRGSWARKFLSKSPFKAEGAVDAVTDKISSVTDKASGVKDKLVSKVGDKLKSKASGKVLEKTGDVAKNILKNPAGRRAAGMVGRFGSKIIPGVGLASMGAEGVIQMQKIKSKGYAELDKKSPGTSRRLETGAYGMQAGAEGLPKTRGTFFGSMK